MEENTPEQQTNKEKQEQLKNSKHTKYFLIVAFAVVLIFFAAMFAIPRFYKPNPYETIEYNHFVFTKIDNTWYTQWQRNGQTFNIGLRYNPLEVENVPIEGNALSASFNRPVIYYTFDPNANSSEFKYLALAAAELGFSFVGAFGKNFTGACIVNETDACAERPIVDCSDKDKSVIKLIGHGETKIILDDNCLILQGEGLELVRAADRALYQFYKIMK